MKVLKDMKMRHASNVILDGKLTDDAKKERALNFLYPLGLVFLVLMVLLFIESKHPYFFLQDDNRDSYLPYFIHNYRSLLSGELALYNFHQFMGIPVLASGQTGTLYPITYIAVFFSNIILGHSFAAVDIQVIVHLLIGALGFYFFIKFLVKDQLTAFFGGLTWALSSSVIYISNSWIVVSAVVAYFPWMMFFGFQLYKNPTQKTKIGAVMMRLFLFYAGHIQYFIYAVIFEFITITAYAITKSEPGKKWASVASFLVTYIKGYVYVFFFSLPLLLPMWNHAATSAVRSGRLPFPVFVSQFFPIDQLIKGWFYPFLQVDGNTYASFRNLLNLSHIGYIPMILLIMGIIDRYVVRKNNIKIESVKLFVFVVPALLAFLWATNPLFNYIVYLIPILNRFRWPFKLALYLDFYLIVIATLILFYMIHQQSEKAIRKNIILTMIIMMQVLNFGFLYTATPYKDFGEHHGDPVPIEEKLKDKLVGGRIISMGFEIWMPTPRNDQSYLTAPTLGFNYATLWGLDHLAGYDVMLSSTNADASLGLNFTAIMDDTNAIPVDHLRQVAVRWYIVPKDKADLYSSKLGSYGIIQKYQDANRVVFYDEQAYPMVFDSQYEPIESDDYKVTTNVIALTVDVPQSETIIFNHIYHPFFVGYVDGEKTEVISIDYLHMGISVPSGKHDILLRYRDPYLLVGIWIAFAFLVLMLLHLVVPMVHKKEQTR